VAESGTDYRGNRHTLRVQRAALADGDRVLLVDDWIETGSQAAAAKQLVESCGARLIGIATVVTELTPGAARDLGRLHALVVL
jgi:adenine phosphoribosyltransferase